MNKYVILICSLLMSLSDSFAQAQMPVFRFEKPIEGKVYYLYNVTHKSFMCGANLWTTQASLSQNYGWKVRIKHYNPTNPNGMDIYIEDSIQGGSFAGQYRKLFIEKDGMIFTDQEAKTSNRDNVWTLVNCNKTNGTYYITLSEYNNVFTPSNLQNSFLGTEYGTKKEIPEIVLCNKNNHIEWGFISEKEFNSKSNEYNKYLKSRELKLLINSVETKYPNKDLSTAKSVYKNPQSTKEDILEQIGMMRVILFSERENQDVVPFTSVLLNPNYDQGYERTWNMRYDDSSGSIYWNGGGHASNPCAESYQTSFDIYQTIEGLPNGLYRMDVQAFYRTRTPELAWFERDTACVITEIYANNFSRPVLNLMQYPFEDKDGKMDFLKTGGKLHHTTISGNANVLLNLDGTYAVDNLIGTSLVFKNGYFDQCMYFAVTDGAATIGIRQDRKRTGSWSAWDNFRLYYLGNGIDSYKTALADKIQKNKEYIQRTEIIGIDNSAINAVITEAERALNSSDVEKIKSSMNKLQYAQDNLRRAWKEHDYKGVTGIGGYEYNQDASRLESATKEKYLDLAQSTYNLAVKMEQSDVQKAIQLYEKAYEFANEDSVSTTNDIYALKFRITINTACLYYNSLKDYVSANTYFTSAMKYIELLYQRSKESYKSDYAINCKNMLLVSMQLNDMEQYDKYLNKALELYTELYETRPIAYRQAFIEMRSRTVWRLLQRGNLDEALKLAKETYTMDETNEILKYDLAICHNDKALEYAKKSDFANAYKYVEFAISLQSNNANFYDTKGEILLMQGKSEEALAMWKKVLELKPNFLDNYPNGTELSKGLKKLGLITKYN